MQPINPILHKLGLSSNDRVVVLHADDIGMCHASVAAWPDLLRHSPLSSAATMTPCPWFPAAAQAFADAKGHPKLDIGVHLTLTAEWDAMRWGPQSTADPSSGLFDAEGYFYRQTEPVQAGADIAAVERELRAQIARASAAGIDFTHIDTHMGTLLHPRFLALYIQLGFEHRVPAFAVRLSAARLVERGYDAHSAEQIAQNSATIEAQGMPLFDNVHMMPLDSHFSASMRLEHATQVINELPVGLTYFLLHPAIDSAELRALAPDWEARVGDYELFMSSAWQKAVERSGVKVIGMRALRDLMR